MTSLDPTAEREHRSKRGTRRSRGRPLRPMRKAPQVIELPSVPHRDRSPVDTTEEGLSHVLFEAHTGGGSTLKSYHYRLRAYNTAGHSGQEIRLLREGLERPGKQEAPAPVVARVRGWWRSLPFVRAPIDLLARHPRVPVDVYLRQHTVLCSFVDTGAADAKMEVVGSHKVGRGSVCP